MLDRDGVVRRFAECESPWLRSFSLESLKVLVVCRGPVRLEAFQVFDEIGVREYGMLLSEKDSVVYPRCLAPELRSFRFPQNVHRVPDYTGAGQELKKKSIGEIVAIARDFGYTHVFAGYGFMAEDADLVLAIERAGVGFMGPSSHVLRRAGAKDEAKKLARSLDNAVIPGVDDVSARALLARVSDRKGLEKTAKEHGLAFSFSASESLEANAEALLQAGFAKGAELVGIAELQKQAERICAEIWRDYPTHRIRFKYIGGGGGKGQRVVSKPDQIAAAVMDVCAESKVIEPGSNRNFLIELNIERTRHNEIQLIGNGDWCLSLGGRDCSVQMHEQKLVELSLTKELLDAEIGRATGKTREVLIGDRDYLARMEAESEKFGEATGLDSVSTFECVVSGFDFFFMEMNTRIQVEHAVTELVYRLRFRNPDDPSESFCVERLIEAMALLAAHGKRVPKPERVPHHLSSIEVRVNATNRALQPHAGGLIRSWSPPLPGELRFDQGIGIRNPDTNSFVYYNVAGAYDSNIALVLTHGESRRENYERMAEVMRRMELRGDDLQTNAEVHYGLIQWLLGRGVMAEPNTRFTTSYLGAVGRLAQISADLDLELAFQERLGEAPDAEARAALEAKETLLLRPLARLFANAHLLGGFLGRYDGELWKSDGASARFVANPVELLERLYHFLDLEARADKPPAEQIWEHDAAVLDAARAFYAGVGARTGARDFDALAKLFAGKPAAGLVGSDDALWARCVAAHKGFQLGLDLLLLIPRVGARSGFLDVRVEEDLTISFPEPFADETRAAELARALAPPPPAAFDEIVTPMGGTFYSREAPHLPPLIEEGQHFDAGQPLFVIEVMKMFNKVAAPHPGTVTRNLMADRDGAIVKKGERVFAIEPDERRDVESDEAVSRRRREATLALLR
ncbi:MAG: biotin/lipoyl-containing protein [Myxococcota bacterium]